MYTEALQISDAIKILTTSSSLPGQVAQGIRMYSTLEARKPDVSSLSHYWLAKS